MQATAQFKRRSTANNVQIIIPVPDDADTPKFRTNIGTVHYTPESSSIVWKIKQFGGGKEFVMRAELNLPSVRGDDDKGGGMMGGFGGSMGGVGAGKSKRPIQVKFEIPYFTTSGIQVRYLKIIEPKVRTSIFAEITSLWWQEGQALQLVCLATWFANYNPEYSLSTSLDVGLWLAFRRFGQRATTSLGPARSATLSPLFSISTSLLYMNLTDSFQLQYPSLPWVRYITQSGDIAVRLPDVQG